MVIRKTHLLSCSAQKVSAKLAPDWEGPYQIIEVKPPNVYVLVMGNGRKCPKARKGTKKVSRGSSN